MQLKGICLGLAAAIMGVVVSASPSSANASCTIDGLPSARVNLAIAPTHTDTTRTLDQLTRIPNDTRIGLSQGHQVGGLSAGEIRFQSQIEFGNSVDFFSGDTCLWVQNLALEIAMDPVIYIARELQRGSCRYRTLLEHEQRHVSTDRRLLQTFRGRIEGELNQKLRSMGPTGPIPVSFAAQVQRELAAEVGTAVNLAMANFSRARDQAQQAIDTPQEYARLSQACR